MLPPLIRQEAPHMNERSTGEGILVEGIISFRLLITRVLPFIATASAFVAVSGTLP